MTMRHVLQTTLRWTLGVAILFAVGNAIGAPQIGHCRVNDNGVVSCWTLLRSAQDSPSNVALARADKPSPGLVFRPCSWPHTCMAPCLIDAPAQGYCLYPNGKVTPSSFACCCCGGGTAMFAPFWNP
jgi:hypothetical protein